MFDIEKLSEKMSTMIKQMDIAIEELQTQNTLLLYIFQAQLKQLDMDNFQQYTALESLMKDNPAVKRYLKK